MRHLPVLFLICCAQLLSAQSTIRTADSLSAASRYLASNELLKNYLRDNPQRLHDQSRALFLMSYNYLQLGSFKQAEDANARSMALRDQLVSGDIAENYMRIGAIALLQGNYEKALDHLFIATSMPIEEPKLYALIYGYIASAFEGLGQPEKALNYYHQSLETLLSATEGSEADVATNHFNIGRVYLGQDKLEAAKASFHQALDISRRVPGRKDLEGNLLNALGETMRQDTPSVAAIYYHQALDIYRSAYGERHRETARTYLNLGQLYFNLNEADSARHYANSSIRSLCPELPRYEPKIEFPKDILPLDRPLLALALHLQAALFLQENDFKYALKYGMSASFLIEEEITALGDDVSKLRLLAKTTDVFEVAVEAAYQMRQDAGKAAGSAISQAFDMAELGKALLLRINVAHALADGLLPAEAAQREAALQAAWRDAEALMVLNPEDPTLRKKAAECRTAYRRFLNQAAKDYPAFDKVYQRQEHTPEFQLRTKLGDNDVLLSYFIGKTDYYIFAVTKSGILCRKITKGRDFKPEDTKVEKFVKKMMNLQGNPIGTGPGVYSKFDHSGIATDLDGAIKGFLQSIKKSDNTQFPHYAQLLYDRLIQPVDSMLRGKTRLLIVPHKALFSMPFEAIISGFTPDDSSPGHHKLNYLIQSYTIQYSYSAAMAPGKSAPAPVSGFLCMAPVFDNNTSQSYIWDSNLFAFDTTYQGSYSMRSATLEGLSFQALPESEREAVGISKLFAKKKKTALAYLRMEADEPTFKANANRHSILHLATHSFVNYANPALSGIAFAQPNISKPSTDDGILYAGEIAGLNLKGVDLVTLSSCESGSGPASGNEGALSLTHSFLSAGAPNVLSSLWKVYDTYTAQLMRLFYEQTLDNKSYATALRNAKLKMIKDNKSADPRKWSGFVLFGAL
ncbi:MAG: CHAT domain-containing protein [Saprospiraceae bacterium]|nr:CHAT domain-containing protein [Saprospiraceae bacterium]MDZ4706474.1 CHAT domain-containing protein [Saprospiraceae bacterium]